MATKREMAVASRTFWNWKLFALGILAVEIAYIVLLGLWGFKHPGGLSTGDLVTLFAGVDAFVAVMIQIEEDHNKQAEERKRESQSVAVVAALEMDYVYRFYVQGTERSLQTNGNGPEAFLMKHVENRPFPGYQRIVNRLGALDMPLVAAVMRFYTDMAAFLMILEKMSSVAERATRSEQRERSKQEWDALVRQCQAAIPHLKQCYDQAFQLLQAFTGISPRQLAALSANTEPDAQAH